MMICKSIRMDVWKGRRESNLSNREVKREWGVGKREKNDDKHVLNTIRWKRPLTANMYLFHFEIHVIEQQTKPSWMGGEMFVYGIGHTHNIQNILRDIIPRHALNASAVC